MGSREEQAEKGLENMQTGEDKQFGGGRFNSHPGETSSEQLRSPDRAQETWQLAGVPKCLSR